MTSNLFDEYPSLLLGLEAGLALFLLLFIVCWTASGAYRRDKRKTQSVIKKD